MKTVAVIPVLNQFEIANRTIEFLASKDDYDILVIDNGSDVPFQSSYHNVSVLRFEEVLGSYPIYKIAYENTRHDILAFFHSDFFVYNERWYRQVENVIAGDPRIGLIGFIGSNQIDILGGRGSGTMSNFQGRTIDGKWSGSPASDHGQTIPNQLRNAAVVDGCSMIFTRHALSQIGFRDNFPPHHFYDRLMSCQVLEAGLKVAVLGIECDHISGQTANKEIKYDQMASEWALKNLGITTPAEWVTKNMSWVGNPQNPSFNAKPQNWDNVIYLEAEKRFLQEYRLEKRFIPISV